MIRLLSKKNKMWSHLSINLNRQGALTDCFVCTDPASPNPFSYFMHQSPEIFHKFETLTNHFVELVVPWFLIGPRRLCMIGGTIQILFQVRCWNRGYGQFSVIWVDWYFVQLEWHLHNINVLYSSFLHERIIKISFDIVKMDKRCCLITLYFISDHYQGQKMFSFSDTAMQ